MLVKYFWLIAAILFAPYAVAQVSKAPVLICTPISQTTVSESGETVAGKPTGAWRGQILIDLQSGIVRQPPSGNAQSYWRIVAKGDSANDWILMLSFDNTASLNSNLARLSGDILRIRNWDKSKPITFFHLMQDSSWSGTCEPIK